MSTLIESPAETVVQLRPSALSAPAGNHPTAVAVSAADCDLTYGELDLWSNRLARLLLARGAGPGIRVALAVTPPVEAAVTRLAIAKTGAIAVPVAPGTPTHGAGLGVTTKAVRRELTDALGWLMLDDRSTLVHYMTGSDAPITDSDRRGAIKIA
jgi:non-ribosomal peptide synthetase component F